jgi:hypothetical protein
MGGGLELAVSSHKARYDRYEYIFGRSERELERFLLVRGSGRDDLSHLPAPTKTRIAERRAGWRRRGAVTPLEGHRMLIVVDDRGAVEVDLAAARSFCPRCRVVVWLLVR